MNKRVVITGMGVVSPLGNDRRSFWEALREGRSGIGPITHFDVSNYPTRFAGEAGDCVPAGMTRKDVNRLDRYSLFALEAADQAWAQSGLDRDKLDLDRCGTIIGSGIGGIETIANEVIRLHEGGPRRVSPFMIPKGLANMASGNVAVRFGFQGPNSAVVTACASSNHSIGVAALLIQLDLADVMMAGGSEAPIVPFGLAGFSSMRALSTRNDAPQKASRPFDKDRDGFVMGEGAGILVLESEDHARARGAEILAEFGGMGETCDAHHITAPRPDGLGGAKAIQRALDAARLNPEDVDYFNAHGTSTPLNEVSEAKALRVVFGARIREGVLPPSINFETPDPECEVNLVANVAREADVAIAVSNSLGFGGHNCAIVLKRHG
jgi:3-oxoacyl-[acyl-carrier-protein] synthase II